MQMGEKNKRTTISNDTLILIQFLIKVHIYRYGSFSPLIFPYILSVSLSVTKDSGNSKESVVGQCDLSC